MKEQAVTLRSSLVERSCIDPFRIFKDESLHGDMIGPLGLMANSCGLALLIVSTIEGLTSGFSYWPCGPTIDAFDCEFDDHLIARRLIGHPS